ncbi:MAG TPA: hypothetical protein VGH86_09040, partial [Phenylobacterium sp.]
MTGATGGCQCGAIRFRIDGELGEASICHCRMCQKALGGFQNPHAGDGAPTVVPRDQKRHDFAHRRLAGEGDLGEVVGPRQAFP